MLTPTTHFVDWYLPHQNVYIHTTLLLHLWWAKMQTWTTPFTILLVVKMHPLTTLYMDYTFTTPFTTLFVVKKNSDAHYNCRAFNLECKECFGSLYHIFTPKYIHSHYTFTTPW